MSDAPPRWYETVEGRGRRLRDEQIVSELQPALICAAQRDGQLALEGDVVVRTRSGVPHRIRTRIDFPAEYPACEPAAHDIANRFTHDADHHFIGDQPCLWIDIESPWRADDPDALDGFLTELALFYFRQLAMEQDPARGYPGPARPHGRPHAYAQVLSEQLRVPADVASLFAGALAGQVARNTRCPCGSHVRYRNCHRRAVNEFRERYSPEQLARVVAALRQWTPPRSPGVKAA